MNLFDLSAWHMNSKTLLVKSWVLFLIHCPKPHPVYGEQANKSPIHAVDSVTTQIETAIVS